MTGSRAKAVRLVRLSKLLAAGCLAAQFSTAEAVAADPAGQPLTIVPAQDGTAPRSDRPSVPVVETEAGPPTGLVAPEPEEPRREIEVDTLGEIALDSLGVLDPQDGGFGVEMWRGSDRHVVERLLKHLPGDIRSRAMRELARRLLLSIASPPVASGAALADDGRNADLLTLRVDRLAALGEVSALSELLSVVPSRHDSEYIARLRVESNLLQGDTTEACRQVRNGILRFHEVPFWQKAMIFCHVAAGERDKAMLGLDLMREQGVSTNPTFDALTNAALGFDAKIPADADLTPLDLAMLRATGLPLPEGAIGRVEPGLLVAIVESPRLSLEVRARAAQRSCVYGLVASDLLAKIYDAFSFPADGLANAIAAAEGMEGPRRWALLYQAARRETLPATRAEVLRVALQSARDSGLYQALVPVFAPLLAEIPAVPELSWFAETAGRTLYADGRYEQASVWLTLGRQETILNPQAAGAHAALWPYSRLAGGAALTTEGSLVAWRAVREQLGDEALDHSQALLRAAFQALGERDPLSWSVLAANGEPVARPLPNAALLYALEEASESRRIGETVLLSLIVLGEAGPADSHTLALSSVLSALNRVGLSEEARDLAIEAALANGV